ncbi:ATP-grasp domain-containing protein [Micromonospora sp. NPDC049799]|uniref:ATP-grasp domain-containing protein n=1 Tax=Micromonospora sp. NPDC049799 TaxID=3154741 RepID=UPI0033E3FE20
MMLLVPCDVVHPRRPDEHFADEAEAARQAGIDVALIDHDAVARGNAADVAVGRLPEGTDAVYRGWMLRSEQYAALVHALADRGVTVRTTSEQYQRAHELPGWYPAVEGHTPKSTWTAGDDRGDFLHACAAFGAGPLVLRDYTKSMKHYWHEACFVPDAADSAAAWRVASRFRQLRGDDYVGGFVLRRFEPFVGAEVRTWWVDGSCRLITAHPDTPDDTPPDDLDLEAVEAPVRALGLPFVTVDLARREDGRWRIVEVGDGQVSDRPRGTPAAELIDALTGEKN